MDITGGAVGALPIAVVPFAADDAPRGHGHYLVSEDLRRSGLFDPMPESDFLTRPSNRDEVQLQNWRTLGADNLVVGRIGREGSQYTVRFELIDVYTGSRIVGKRYTAEGDEMRRLAHTISNEIFEALVGRPGAFNTRIAYVRAEGAASSGGSG
ncbi:MAG: hypothetical protein U5L11_13900 [Arhodomonas sp.]|nr:hypothetical protein [Arhodomonas sp.]